jgi:SAM-dependent methyltransferase
MSSEYDVYAKTYDLEYGLLSDDLPFYLDLAKRSGGPALELAVGTGRVALHLARAGIPVLGVDGSPAMLEVLAEKLAAEPELPLAFALGDMRDFDATEHGPFPLIYVPGRAFLHLLTIEDQFKGLANVARHLADDGIFAGNFFFPSVELLHRRQNLPPPKMPNGEFTDPETGLRVRAYEIPKADTYRQRVDVINRLEYENADGEVVKIRNRDLTLTYIWPRELEHLFARAGFTITELYQDFKMTPFGPGGGELVWVAKKA